MLLTPLFMQTGDYTAAADRILIGGQLYPQGGSTQAPRYGIRPSGLVNGEEASFQVSSSGTSGNAEIRAGAAYTAVIGETGLNSVYLVVNDGPIQQPVAIHSFTGVKYLVKLYLVVEDAVNTVASEGSTSAIAKFDVLDANLAPPAGGLLLATIEVPTAAGNAVRIVSDDRIYTTGHGGAVSVPSKTVLETPPPDGLLQVPYGSQAYVAQDGLMWTKSKRGWEPSQGAVKSGDIRPTENLYDGMLWFDTKRGLLQVYVGGTWQTVGQIPGVVAETQTALATSTFRAAAKYTDPNPANHFWVNIPVPVQNSTGYLNFDDAAVIDLPDGVASPTSASLSLYARVKSYATIVSVSLSASAWVPDPADHTKYLNENVFLAVQVVPLTPGGSTNYTVGFLQSGHAFYGKYDMFKSRTVNYHLEPGDYMFRPVIGTGATASVGGRRHIQFHQIAIEVEL